MVLKQNPRTTRKESSHVNIKNGWRPIACILWPCGGTHWILFVGVFAEVIDLQCHSTKFKESEKAQTRILTNTLIFVKYDGNGNFCEHILGIKVLLINLGLLGLLSLSIFRFIWFSTLKLIKLATNGYT